MVIPGIPLEAGTGITFFHFRGAVGAEAEPLLYLQVVSFAFFAGFHLSITPINTSHNNMGYCLEDNP